MVGDERDVGYYYDTINLVMGKYRIGPSPLARVFIFL